jgi:hypothetical protein
MNFLLYFISIRHQSLMDKMNLLKNLSMKKYIFLGVSALVLLILLALGFRALEGDPRPRYLTVGEASTNYAPAGFARNAYAEKMVAMDAPSVPGEVANSLMPRPPELQSAAPAVASKLIKSADLTLLVENVDEAAEAIGKIRITFGGQPGNENFSEYGNGRYGDMTIWVPAQKFDDAILSIKKLALKVNNERVGVEDVSAQFVDLESRLKNLKVAEAQYQEIMKRSGKVSDILEVTRALTETRGQIEETQGRVDYLSRQVALSSIHISLTEEASPGTVVSDEWRPMSVVKVALNQNLRDLTNLLDEGIVLLVGLPLLLVRLAFFGAILYALFRLGRYAYRRLVGASAPRVL